jgi:hypothetical protein
MNMKRRFVLSYFLNNKILNKNISKKVLNTILDRMSRPLTLEGLSEVYTRMTEKWVSTPSEWRIDPLISMEDTRVYNAIYTYGSWNLEPKTWQRLQVWLQPLLTSGISYAVNPSRNEGRLHFTFHQLSSMFNFNTSVDSVKPIHYDKLFNYLNELRGILVHYRGLLVTPTGLALCGFPADTIQLEKLMNLRNKLSTFLKEEGIDYNPPYVNDLCHSTLFRWTSAPSEIQIKYIQTQVIKWEEAYFGSCTPTIWHHGLGTLLMKYPNTIELQTIYLPIFIAHRGLTNGPDKMKENSLEIIKQHILFGMYVELDIWYVDNRLYLGHDKPEILVELKDIVSKYCWIHTKNKEALEYLMAKRKEGIDIQIFWHTTENYCITTNNNIIVFPGEPLLNNSVFMMPENAHTIKLTSNVQYVCSDYIENSTYSLFKENE